MKPEPLPGPFHPDEGEYRTLLKRVEALERENELLRQQVAIVTRLTAGSVRMT